MRPLHQISLRPHWIAAVFAAYSMLSAPAAAQTCNNLSLKGAYAYVGRGTLTVDGRSITNSHVGRMVFDGNGGFTGAEANTNNGNTSVYDFTGTYAVGSDCTVTGTFQLPDGTSHFDAVVVNAGADLLYVVRDPNTTLSGEGTKIEALSPCSVPRLRGSFGYAGDGVVTVDGRILTVAEIGIMTFDGAGGVRGYYSAVAAGQAERQEFSGSYAVADNCTANARIRFGETTHNINFVIGDMSNSIFYSEVGPNIVLTGSMARMAAQQ